MYWLLWTKSFDLVGVDGPWTGNNYGWTDNIRNARVINTRDGYTIKFPRANPIDQEEDYVRVKRCYGIASGTLSE